MVSFFKFIGSFLKKYWYIFFIFLIILIVLIVLLSVFLGKKSSNELNFSDKTDLLQDKLNYDFSLSNPQVIVFDDLWFPNIFLRRDFSEFYYTQKIPLEKNFPYYKNYLLPFSEISLKELEKENETIMKNLLDSIS